MIARNFAQAVRQRLTYFPAVALLGPRQVGKTTLARKLAEEFNGTYLDLENPSHRARLENPTEYLNSHLGRLLVLDEIQRMPNIFEVLRGTIDEARHQGISAGQYLILGSASRDLLAQSSETLAGRIAYLELTPLLPTEVDPDQLATLWLRGGFPNSFLAPDDTTSTIWREDFLRTYLEREVAMFAPRIPTETLRRFWTMLAHNQGNLFNAADLARALDVTHPTTARYLDLMCDLLLVRRLPPWHANTGKRLIKSPKVYIRDSGITHTLLGIPDHDSLLSHPVCGRSWEGLVVESLCAAAPASATPYFYRTMTGVEVDSLLSIPGHGLWTYEIKRSIHGKITRGFHEATKDLNPQRSYMIHSGTDRFSLAPGVEAIGIHDAMNDLSALSP